MKKVVSIFTHSRDPWPTEIREMEIVGQNQDGFEIVIYDGTQYALRAGTPAICLAYPVPENKRIEVTL